MVKEREMDFLWQTSRRSPAMTGLPVTVWVDDGGAYLRAGGDKRIWFQMGGDDSMTARLGAMDLDGNVIGSNDRYDSDLVRQIGNFVCNNRYALETLADGKLSVEDVWPLIIRGGEPVSEDKSMLKNKLNTQCHYSLHHVPVKLTPIRVALATAPQKFSAEGRFFHTPRATR